MPLYEFYCEACENKFEKIIKDTTIEAHHCPFCAENGKDNLAFKILSKTNFKINGYNSRNGYSKTQ